MDAGDDEEHHEGLRHAQQVLGVLALDARHDALPGARYEQVELGEGWPEDAADDAEEDGGQHGDHVHGDQVLRVLLSGAAPFVQMVFCFGLLKIDESKYFIDDRYNVAYSFSNICNTK